MPTPFIVLNTIRSGSTHLTRMLNAHPDIVCNGEVFNDQDPDYNWPGPPPRSTKEMIQAAFVDYPGKERNPKAVGCKLLDSALFGEPTRLGELLAVENLKVIVLIRRNQFECFRSVVQAWSTDNWQEAVGGVKTALSPVTLSPIHCKAFFERAAIFYGKLALLVPPEQRITVDYEDLAAKKWALLDSLCDFLEVKRNVAPYGGLQKMETRPLSESVANYDELQLLFEHTEYGVFLP